MEANAPKVGKTSPPLKWHGGKGYLAKHIHRLAPPSINADPSGYTHRLTPFAGGLGELWGWECEGISETVNDLNPSLSYFWHVLGEPALFEEFARRVEATPFSEPAWNRAIQAQQYSPFGRMPIEAAVDFFVRFRQSRQGLGKCFATPTKRTRRGMNENVSAWLSAVDGLPDAHARLRRVEVRSMPAVKFIATYDHARALFYCDPPYLHETRHKGSTDAYQCEMSVEQHEELLTALAGIKGKFMLSGYPSQLYDDCAPRHGWRCEQIEIDNKASGAKVKEKKIECIWMNYGAAA